MVFFLTLISCKQKQEAESGVQEVYTTTVTNSVIRDLDADTLSTSSTLDTLTFALGTFTRPYNYEIQVNADSLSGATGATCYLELSLDGDGADWVQIETAVVNGVTTRSLNAGSFERGQLRCRCYAPSSTQSTAVRVDFAASNQ